MDEMGMVERMARAYCIAEGSDPDGSNGPGFGPHWHGYIKMALTGLRAMREPTEAQIDAAYEAASMDDAWCVEDADQWSKSFRAAIDAALADVPASLERSETRR